MGDPSLHQQVCPTVDNRFPGSALERMLVINTPRNVSANRRRMG